ncbi:MAG TPA: M28 family peptidase [Gemmatimonadales bacterium]
MKTLLVLSLLLWVLVLPLSAQSTDPLAISSPELGARLRFFSSDLFEGRYPGTRGETLTTSYLISELQSFGVAPAASQVSSDSSWLQPVELLVQRPDSTAPVQARLTGRITRALAPGREITFVNAGRSGDVNAAGELVFVGYGIDAPIYRWNDFAGLDLEGKIAIVLTGEPTLSGDTVRFNGVRASRFSWFEDKLADLERRGAAGVLIIRPDGSLQSPVRVGRHLATDVSGTGLRFIGGITDSALARLVPPKSRSLSALIDSANRPGFRAVPFGVKLSVSFHTRPATVTSHNVIGTVPGTDSAVAGQHVVLSAHWDAYGIGKPIGGDSIYNGALDDGSGVTALLALARVLAHHPQRRSLTFLFTTAEEWGLFGAKAFVCSGSIPLDRIAANLNLDDGIELLGPKRDAAPLGVELSTLGETVRRVAKTSGIRVSPDPYPQEGFFLRADNYPFARAGIPSLYMALGTDAVGSSKQHVDSMVQMYLQQHYHQPSDEYRTVAIDLEGSRQFAEFVRDVAIAVANDSAPPTWLPGGEFQRSKNDCHG